MSCTPPLHIPACFHTWTDSHAIVFESSLYRFTYQNACFYMKNRSNTYLRHGQLGLFLTCLDHFWTTTRQQQQQQQLQQLQLQLQLPLHCTTTTTIATTCYNYKPNHNYTTLHNNYIYSSTTLHYTPLHYATTTTTTTTASTKATTSTTARPASTNTTTTLHYTYNCNYNYTTLHYPTLHYTTTRTTTATIATTTLPPHYTAVRYTNYTPLH